MIHYRMYGDGKAVMCWLKLHRLDNAPVLFSGRVGISAIPCAKTNRCAQRPRE